jgi:hypothetical protein
LSEPAMRAIFSSGSPAIFHFRPTLAKGQTSESRQFTFANPNTVLFTIQVVITGRVQVAPGAATRWEPEPPASNLTLEQITQVFTGVVPAMDRGANLAAGVTYIDIPFTGRDRVISVNGRLSSPTADTVNPLTPNIGVSSTDVDLDLYLFDSLGSLLAASESATSNESVTASIKPRKDYFYRVVGWQGAASEFRLESTQSVLALNSGNGSSAPAGDSGSSSLTSPSLLTRLRFTVNPIAKTINAQLVSGF